MKRVLFNLGFVILFFSCSSDDTTMETELIMNRQLWESSKISNYSWTEILSCECAGPLLREIYVVDNIKDRIDYDESLLFDGYTHDVLFDATHSIEEAFDFIDSLIARNVASLDVDYDDMYGFPTSISIDYDKDYVDDEILFRYTNFEIAN